MGYLALVIVVFTILALLLNYADYAEREYERCKEIQGGAENCL